MPAKRLKLPFHPAGRGLRKILGDLELAVMESVWRRGQATVREVHEDLAADRGLAYTTVMTVMTRLARKGLLQKRRDGAAFVYHAPLSADELLRSSVRDVLAGLLTDFAQPTMSEFVETVKTGSADRIDELKKLVDDARRKRK
jgi:predicted transcriptional regulator